MTKYNIRQATRFTSSQNISIDGMPRHIRDLFQLPTYDSDVFSESERIMVGDTPDEIEPGLEAAESSSSDDSFDEDPVNIPLRRSIRRKRPALVCLIVDHKIRGEFNNNRQKRQRVCVACARRPGGNM